MSNTITELVQEVYFDLVDLLNQNSYKDLGYDNKKDFFMTQLFKLEQIEYKVARLEGIENEQV